MNEQNVFAFEHFTSPAFYLFIWQQAVVYHQVHVCDINIGAWQM